jgi:hypothetical protein
LQLQAPVRAARLGALSNPSRFEQTLSEYKNLPDALEIAQAGDAKKVLLAVGRVTPPRRRRSAI